MLVALGLIQNCVIVCGIGFYKLKLYAVKAGLSGNFTGNSASVTAPGIKDDKCFSAASCFFCAGIGGFASCDCTFYTVICVADKTKSYIVKRAKNKTKSLSLSLLKLMLELFQMKNMTENQRASNLSQFTYPLKWQIPLGLIFTALNLGVKYLQNFNPIPLYMDTIFTITASFFGLFSGLICAILYHISCTLIFHFDASTLVWVICSLTIVIIVRIYIKIRKKIEIPDLFLLVFLISLIVSLEGATIFTLLNVFTGYREDSQVKFMYALLSSNSISVFISALLPRVPVNILDKAISVSIGWACYKGIGKLISPAKKA